MKNIVIIGGGFGGLTAAKELANKNFHITVIDKTNHHLFQPLLYQVATAALSPADIAIPIRSVLCKYKNVDVILGKVKSIDKKNKKVLFDETEISFDYLIVAIGFTQFYFGKDEWEKFALSLKTLNDALKTRENILLSLENAELEQDPILRQKYLSFVIVGGGPTGVELAGAISEIVKKNIIPDFRQINASMTKIYLIEGLPSILSAYPKKLSDHAIYDLKNLGVEVILNEKVSMINEKGVLVADRLIETKNILWAAGNKVSSLIKTLETKIDNIGRVIVNDDLSIESNENIFVIGDAAAVKNDKGELLPAIAPVAMQQGKYVAKFISSGLERNYRNKFIYKDRGIMATIGKGKAVALIKGMKFTGYLAWLVWSFVHIFFLISFRNRFRVMSEWIWQYFTNRPSIRLIVKHTKNNIQ